MELRAQNGEITANFGSISNHSANFSGNNRAITGLNTLATGFVTLIFIIVVLTTLTGNVLVCLAVLLVRKLRQPGNYLLVSLAVVDFCVGSIVMPFAYAYLVQGKWAWGHFACALWTSADVAVCTASILNLCAISVDRYWAITKPLTYAACDRTTGRILIYIALVWVFALLISVLPLFAFEKPQRPGVCMVSQNIFYQIYATMGSFYVPTGIMLTVNYQILKAARRLYQADVEQREMETVKPNQRSVHTSLVQPPALSERRKLKIGPIRIPLISQAVSRSLDFKHHAQRSHWLQHEGKALKTLGIIMGAFITCWLPFFIVALVKPICGNNCKIPSWLDVAVLWLGYLNSMLNPLIYAKYNRDFRIPFRELLCCRFSTLQTVLRNEMFVESYGPPPNSATNMPNNDAATTIQHDATHNNAHRHNDIACGSCRISSI